MVVAFSLPFFHLPTIHYCTTHHYIRHYQHNHSYFVTLAAMSAQDIPSGEFQDNEYKSRTGHNQIPVQSDDKPIEDPIDGDKADTDAQLGSSLLNNPAL